MIGRTVAHFRVVARIGAGAMGEIYRAFDTQLGRDVALKVLPQEFGADRELAERLSREARLLAALNHPHVAAIYGLAEGGPGDAPPALVMELVEGPTLSDRLASGPLAIPQALDIAKQIAEGLEYAHDRGVIHRDLKPANIKLTPDDQVKILDFGLAKALTNEGEAASNQSTALSSATRVGAVIGTPAYMPPEQAKGRAADRRSDIWSFGVVLFEMLTGARPFGGDTASEALAAVIRDDPDWNALPVNTPRTVRELLGRCLTKDVRMRLQAIGEARIALERAATGSDEEAPDERAHTHRSTAVRALPWGLAAALAAAALLLWHPWRPPAAAQPAGLRPRLFAELSPGVFAFGGAPSAVELSPDGLMLAFRGREKADAPPRIYVRRLDELTARALPGTEDASGFFFSHDGKTIGFFVEKKKLNTVPVSGGEVFGLCDVNLARGGSWTSDGRIVFAFSSRGALSIVSDRGGAPQPLTKLDDAEGEITHRFPQVLPGDRGVIFTSHTNSISFDEAVIKLVPLSGGKPREILRGGYLARYVSSGHLLFMNHGTLYAVPFDLGALKVTGERVPVVQGIASGVGSALAQYSVSTDGMLAYMPGVRTGGLLGTLDWLMPDNKTEPVRRLDSYQAFRVSPDGRQVAIQIFGGERTRVWIHDIQRGTTEPLNGAGGNESGPIWTADGKRIAYSSDRDGRATPHIYWKRVDGVGEEQQLTTAGRTERETPGSFTADGRTLLYSGLSVGPLPSIDVFAVRLDGSEQAGWKPQEAVPLLRDKAAESSPALSPNGRWLAYVSDESGQNEVYVRRYPELDQRVVVSSGGGGHPAWSGDSNQLFFVSGRHVMVVTSSGAGTGFATSKARRFADMQIAANEGLRNFDIHPGGQRALVFLVPAQEPDLGSTNVVLWFGLDAELRRLLTTSAR